VERAQVVIGECADVLFESAPIMMHSIDSDFRLVHVNRRWLQTLRYGEDEVLGRQPFEFLTEESRTRHVTDVVPLFVSSGSVRGIGVWLLRKDGQVLGRVLDVDTIPAAAGTRFTYAALYDGQDLSEWQQASAVLRTLNGLHRARDRLDRVLATKESEDLVLHPSEEQLPDATGQSELETDNLEELFSITQDMEVNLQTMAELEEQHVHELQNRRQELLLLAETLQTTLADLTGRTEEPQGPGATS